jgi:hypothetical protein
VRQVFPEPRLAQQLLPTEISAYPAWANDAGDKTDAVLKATLARLPAQGQSTLMVRIL